MRDKFTDVIRVGIVSSIDPIKGTAQVIFEDRANMVSGDLHIISPCTLEDKYYYMPDIGERVWVMFDPEAPSKGCILGSYYADNRLPPIGDKNKAYIKFKDDTILEYDRELHKLTIHVASGGEKSIDIVAESDISVQTSGNLIVEAAKDIDILSAQTINVIALQDVNISAAKGINVTAKDPIYVKSDTYVSISGALTTTIIP